jgi:hypothetical protein
LSSKIQLDIRETFRRIVLGRVATQSQVGQRLLAAQAVAATDRCAERRFRLVATRDELRVLLSLADRWSPADVQVIREALTPRSSQESPVTRARTRAVEAPSMVGTIRLLAGG